MNETPDRKWSGTQRNLLTAVQVKNAAAGQHRDGGGLTLEVDGKGKRWVYRQQVAGRRREFGLGSAIDVPLAEARKRADELRAKLRNGIDPRAEKIEARKREDVPTFAEAARTVHELRMQSWSNGKHQAQWISTLNQYAVSVFGTVKVADVRTDHVLRALTPLWHTKQETARRVRQRIETVLDWAKAKGFRTGDNAADLVLIGDALGLQRMSGKHHTALPYAEVGAFIRDLRAGQADEVTKLAFEFLILTAVRTTEVRGAIWEEIDWQAKTWTIPAARMKAKRDHVVPLTNRALAILGEQQDRAIATLGDSPLIFRDVKTGRRLSENRFLNARTAIGYGDRSTPHGFRSSFRDWAAEETHFPPEVAEMALAHAIGNKVEAAYRRGDLLAKRRELMAAWDRYISLSGTP